MAKPKMMNDFDFSVKKAVSVLNEKGVLLYPTDTVWGLGCDATDNEAVMKIFRIKQRSESKSLILLVADIQMLEKYVEVPHFVLDFLEKQERPTSVIYHNTRGLAQNVIASDNTVAIRIVKNDFCQKLIEQFGKPIVSTSANRSGFPTPLNFSQIEDYIKNKVDYIVDYQQNIEENCPPSQLVKIKNASEIEILRR